MLLKNFSANSGASNLVVYAQNAMFATLCRRSALRRFLDAGQL